MSVNVRKCPATTKSTPRLQNPPHGYSAVLNILVRWDNGQLRWFDPETNEEVPTFDQEREGRLAEQEARIRAEARAEIAEARVRKLEEELERRDRGG